MNLNPGHLPTYKTLFPVLRTQTGAPFGDYDLIFGAAKLGLKIVDLPVRYRARTYGSTNIQRWSHGLLLLRMVIFAAKKIKFT